MVNDDQGSYNCRYLLTFKSLSRYAKKNIIIDEARKKIDFSIKAGSHQKAIQSGILFQKQQQWKKYKEFFDTIGPSLSPPVRSLDDWYQVKQSDVEKFKGSDALAFFGGSLCKAITSVYLEHNWKIWKFPRVYDGFWKDKNNCIQFFDDLAKKLGYSHWEDWYQISYKDVSEHGGDILLNNFYQNSTVRAITATYDNHPWQLWKFRNFKVFPNYWDDKKNVLSFMEYAFKEFGLRNVEDWNLVSSKEFQSFAGKGKFLIEKYGGFSNLLSEVYPSVNWKKETRGFMSKAQRFLFNKVQEIFPHSTDVCVNYPHPQLQFSGSRRLMELDIFIPSLQLAFEYQGSQHYSDHFRFLDLSGAMRRDQEKKLACESIKITLIIVPYWWDRKVESLILTIKESRPDLIPDSHPMSSLLPHAQAIPDAPKSNKL